MTICRRSGQGNLPRRGSRTQPRISTLRNNVMTISPEGATRSRLKFGADLAAPGAVFEGLSRPGSLLDRCNVLPGFVVAWPVSMMERIENAKLSLPRSIQDLQ